MGVDYTKANTTWADGHGNWHALVPSGPSAAHLARHLIRCELQARDEVRRGYVIYLTRVSDHGDLTEYCESGQS